MILLKVELGIMYIHDGNISFELETVWDGALCAGQQVELWECFAAL